MYQIQFIFSEVWATKDNIPQLAHVDMKYTINQCKEDHLGIKSCVAFTPINPDGMMLQVCTEGNSKKHHSIDEVIEDEECMTKDKDPKPGPYIFLIVVLWSFPEIQLMQEVSVFVREWHAQAELEAMMQNHHHHFIFVAPDWLRMIVMEKQGITIVG